MNDIPKDVMDWYTEVRHVPLQGLCGLGPLVTTIGLYCGLNPISYSYRYCYENYQDALAALNAWDGKGHPSGPWIVRKGEGGDLQSPNYSPPS